MSNVTLDRSTRSASFRSFGVAPEVSELSPFDFQKSIGLDWEVAKEAPFFGMLETKGPESKRCIGRQDTRAALGYVGEDYAIVQNGELFQFFADMAEFDLGVKFVAGGCLGLGEIVWALARVPSMRHVLNGNDILDTFVGVSNGHGGNATLKVDIYTFRKICSNGMHGLTRTKSGETAIGKGWNLKHTTGISDRFAQAQTVLRCIAADHAATMEAAERMAATPATFETVEAIATHVWGAVPAAKEGKNANKGRTIALNRLEDLRGIWNSPTSKGIGTEGTLWAAVNAVTEWAEHESIVRTGNYTQEESRFLGNYLGGSASTFKEEAYSFALSLV